MCKRVIYFALHPVPSMHFLHTAILKGCFYIYKSENICCLHKITIITSGGMLIVEMTFGWIWVRYPHIKTYIWLHTYLLHPHYPRLHYYKIPTTWQELLFPDLMHRMHDYVMMYVSYLKGMRAHNSSRFLYFYSLRVVNQFQCTPWMLQ